VSTRRGAPARGEVPVRLIVFGLVGIALLAVPLWFLKKEGRARVTQADARERAAAAPPPAAASPQASPDRFGVSFGWWPTPSDPRAMSLSCQAPPQPLDNPLNGACNPALGDTSCRTALPLLCARSTAPGRFMLATTAEVPGFALGSRAEADARCVAGFGADWRMAGYHDGGNGELSGGAPDGFDAARHRRVWVAIDGARANCWDAPP